jgi:hypothetical protein
MVVPLSDNPVSFVWAALFSAVLSIAAADGKRQRLIDAVSMGRNRG